MKNKLKNKKSKIPLCPQKNKPIKKKINKINPLIEILKQPSTPSLLSTKKLYLNNNLNTINNRKQANINNNNKNISINLSKKNLFHAIIPRSKSHSENNLKKQKIILIKKIEKSNKISFDFKNIKEYNYKKNENNNNLNNDNISKEDFKNKIKEKETLSSNNSHYMNNTKANTNSNTTIGMSEIFSDRGYKQENNNLCLDSKNSNNPLEFTFGETNFLKNNIYLETKTSLIKNNSFQMSTISNNNNNFESIDRISYNSNDKKIFKKNIIKNIKYVKSKLKENNLDNSKANYNIKNYSYEKGVKIKEENRIYKFTTSNKWPKICSVENNKHKTPKIAKKYLNLIPVDKKYNLNKKHKLIIKKNFESNDNNKNLNLEVSTSTKNKDKKNLHKLFLNQNSNKTLIKTNKSSPKLFLKHPSLKNLFDS